jgi:TonB family protein
MNPPLWLDNLAAYGIQIAIVIVVGTALPFAFRLRPPGIMLPYLQGLLVACVLLPVLQPWSQGPADTPGTISTVGVEIKHIAFSDRAHDASLWVYSVIQLVIIGGFVVRLGWLAMGVCRLRRYRRNAPPLEALPDAITEMQSITGACAEVRISGEINSPGTFGVRPVILFPAGFLQMDDKSQKAIACHELLHVRRRDWLYILLEEVVGALLWFHPAVWWLLGKIELSREQLIDREVLQITGSPKAYLEALLQIAQSKGQPEVTLAPSFLTRHHLVRRVAMIVTEVSMSRVRCVMFLSISGALLLAAGTVATRAFPLQKPTQGQQDESPKPEKPKREAIRVGGDVKPPKIILRPNPAYPEEAKQKGVQGGVVMEVTVNEKGEVWDARVVRGESSLQNAALEAVRRWRFSPALLNGNPVPILVHVEMEFRLDNASAPAGSRPIRVDEKIHAAKLLYQVQPEYPEEAKRLRIEGEVVLLTTVDEGGAVIDAHPMSGHQLLTDAAVQAVRQWKYSSTLLNGEPVKVEATVTISFKLN